MTRRELRIFSMQILYSMELRNIGLDEAIEYVNDDNYDVETKEFLKNVVSNLEEIDEVISRNLEGYTISRLNLVDKEILRIAVYEMLKTDTEIQVIINEALEITKKFSDEGNHKAVSFNNRLLQNIYEKEKKWLSWKKGI